MEAAQFVSTVKDLLAKGRTAKAIKILVGESKDFSKKLQDEALIISGWYEDLQRKERMGTVSVEKMRIEQNKIHSAILDLVAEIGNAEGKSSLSNDAGSKPSRQYNTVRIIVVSLVLVGLVFTAIAFLLPQETSVDQLVDIKIYLTEENGKAPIHDLSGGELAIFVDDFESKSSIINGIATFQQMEASLLEKEALVNLIGQKNFVLIHKDSSYLLASNPVRIPVKAAKDPEEDGGLRVNFDGDNNQFFNMGDSSVVNQQITIDK